MNIVNCQLTHQQLIGDILLLVKEVECGVRKIILIKDSVSGSNRDYTKTTMPLNKETIDGNPPTMLFDNVEKSNDVSELIVNQIIATAVSNIASTNVYVVNSDNLNAKRSTYSIRTIRYFVKKSKEHGNIFLFIGNDKMSKLVARLWGFDQARLS